ncbi:hypothetical protein BGZ65_000826 [Modicella reniformis]|uniref:RNI-like protein n=1 Tax=Modicella reniformis TaxID=1440133 RepID=A0A9P6MJV9_9FUNG|nr:hypothetical protein BGZ65_000826 [Modicella reniformis]
MPPKRTASSKQEQSVTKKARTPVGLSKQAPSNSSVEDEDEDSEKEIETVKDYEDAVRRRRLTSTTARYDDTLERNHLAFTASLMMSASELHPVGAVTKEREIGTPRTIVFSLGTFCLHAIAEDFKHLASDTVLQQRRWQQEIGSIQEPPQQQQQLARQRRRGAYFRKQVQHLPFYLSAKLFKLLKYTKPELLSTKIWTNLFYPVGYGDKGGTTTGFQRNGNNITELDLEGLIASQVTDAIIQNYILGTLDLGPQLETINLNYMDDLSDKALAQLVGDCPRLTRLSLKGCSKAGDLTLARLTQESLEELNISFVSSPTAKGIKQLIMQCRGLKVLKMAGITAIKDALFLDLEKELVADTKIAMAELEDVINQAGRSRPEVLLSLCGKTLKRLDISATNVTRLAPIVQFCVWEESCSAGDIPMQAGSSAKATGVATSTSPSTSITKVTHLEKLNITRLKVVSPMELLTLFKKLPPRSLHTLLMGYLSCGLVPIKDDLLHQFCAYLEPDQINYDGIESTQDQGTFVPVPYISNPFTSMPEVPQEQHLHTLSLFGNPQVGQSKKQDYGLYLLLKRLSPFLKRLELGYTQCKATILKGLVVPRDHHSESDHADILKDNPVLEELGLDGTPIDDDTAIILTRFQRLNRLSVANTRIGKEAVEMVIEACPLLTSLDLTSCRGIPLLHRRTLLKEVRQVAASLRTTGG